MRPAITSRVVQPGVALETTLLCHGVPRDQALSLATRINGTIRAHGAHPALIGVIDGKPIVGMTDAELSDLLAREHIPKLNAANLGLAMHHKTCGATTVSATMELGAAAGISVFATGALGGIHPDLASHLDISSDLGALTRFPVAVVTSGVKSILDVEGTREALEALGIPVVGFRTDRFPAFYLRDGRATVDARFDDETDLAAFLRAELARTNRAVVVANPIPEAAELDRADLEAWTARAREEASASRIAGRQVTPFILGRLHAHSAGGTLEANIALVLSNSTLAARVAALMDS